MKRGSRREGQGCSRVSALSGAGKGCPVDVSNLKVRWKRCRRGHPRQDGLLVDSWLIHGSLICLMVRRMISDGC